MPCPPRTPPRGVWRMGARLWISRIFKRCRSLSAALFVLCFWLCLITVINPVSNSQQGNLELKEDAHLLIRSGGFASYPALLDSTPIDKRMETSSSVKLEAKLVLRNELKASITGFHTVMKAQEDGQTSNLVKNGIISGRRIQEIKSSQMGGLETLSRRYVGDQREGDTRRSMASNVLVPGEREQIDTKAITVMEMRPDIQTRAKNLGDLRPNWTRELEPHVSHFSSLSIPEHERSQARQESKPSSAVSSRAKNSPSKSATSDRKTRSDAHEMPAMMVKHGLQTQGKSISSHLPQNIGEMHNRQSNFYESNNGAINRHFNGDERYRVREREVSRDLDNSPGHSIENSYHDLTESQANLDSDTNTQGLNPTGSKSNRENSVAMQMNVPEGSKEFSPHDPIDQDIQPSAPQMNSGVKYPGPFPLLHHTPDKSNKPGDGLDFLQPERTTDISHERTRNGSNVISHVNSPVPNDNKNREDASHSGGMVSDHPFETGSLSAVNSSFTSVVHEKQMDNGSMARKGAIKTQWKSNDLKFDGFEVFSYNVTASDALPLSRQIPDTRPGGCSQLPAYNSSDLPRATVIICFHNEAPSVLLRTVHSVLNRTPQHLLDQIILVDDFSATDELHRHLTGELNNLPKVSVTRTERREGLVRARLLGSSLASSEVIVFLDSHCECNLGWLEPLLFSLAQDKEKVVSPYIDTVRAENFKYKQSPAQLQGGFNWRLEFGWRAASRAKITLSETQPIPTPVISGGLFAVRRDYFVSLGGYDPELDIWGGENFELSFKTWMCGGKMEIVPCSRVGHVFRATLPYTFTKDREETVMRNLGRVASVWMDDYAEIFYAAVNFPTELDIGDTSEREQLRKDLKCHSFRWYLETVFPQMDVVSQDTVAYGQVRNKGSLMCLDVMSSPAGYYLGLSACHGGRNQTFRLTSDKRLRQAESCIVPGLNKQLSLSRCSTNVQWILKNGRLHLNHTNLCMTSVDNEVVQLLPCDDVYKTSVLITNQQHEDKAKTNDFHIDNNSSSGAGDTQHTNSFQQWTVDSSFNWKRKRRRSN